MARAQALDIAPRPDEPQLLRRPEGEPQPAAFGRTWRRRACRAISRTVALPEPLSFIPGPLATESRWAPRRITPLSASGQVGDGVRLPRRRGRDRRGRGAPWQPRRPERAASAPEPTPDEMTSTGIRPPGPKSVAERGAVRPGSPSFAISAAEAPPACAMAAFCENGQPPRRISAIAPCANPLKSESVQPPEPPTGTTGAVTFPPPSSASSGSRGCARSEGALGAEMLEHRRSRLWRKYGKEKVCCRGRRPAARNLPHHIGHRLRIPRRACSASSIVPFRDRFESLEVRTQMAGRDRAGQRLSRGRRAGRRSSLEPDGRVADSRSEQEPDSDLQSETSHVS